MFYHDQNKKATVWGGSLDGLKKKYSFAWGKSTAQYPAEQLMGPGNLQGEDDEGFSFLSLKSNKRPLAGVTSIILTPNYSQWEPEDLSVSGFGCLIISTQVQNIQFRWLNQSHIGVGGRAQICPLFQVPGTLWASLPTYLASHSCV